MERPNNKWFTPVIAGITAGLTGATLSEQKLTRQATEKSAKAQQLAAEKSAKARQLAAEEKKAKPQLKVVLDVRSGIKQNSMSYEQGLEYCHRLGITDPKKCLGEDNTGNIKRTNSIFKSNLNTDALLIENNFQPEDIYLNSNFIVDHQAFTADCCNEVDSFQVSSSLVSSGAPSPKVSPSFFNGSIFAGLLGAAIFVSGYSILEWLKTKNPTVKKYFTTNEEYFTASYELLHKKLDTIIENQQKN